MYRMKDSGMCSSLKQLWLHPRIALQCKPPKCVVVEMHFPRLPGLLHFSFVLTCQEPSTLTSGSNHYARLAIVVLVKCWLMKLKPLWWPIIKTRTCLITVMATLCLQSRCPWLRNNLWVSVFIKKNIVLLVACTCIVKVPLDNDIKNIKNHNTFCNSFFKKVDLLYTTFINLYNFYNLFCTE